MLTTAFLPRNAHAPVTTATNNTFFSSNMGCQSQRRDGAIAKCKKRATSRKKKHVIVQCPLPRGVAFVSRLHCRQCIAIAKQKKGGPVPHKAHDRRCFRNTATRGMSETTVMVNRVAKANIIANNVPINSALGRQLAAGNGSKIPQFYGLFPPPQPARLLNEAVDSVSNQEGPTKYKVLATNETSVAGNPSNLREEILPGTMIEQNLARWIVEFKNAKDDTGRSLFTQNTEKVANEQLKKVQHASDPTGVEMYQEIPPGKGALTNFPSGRPNGLNQGWKNFMSCLHIIPTRG